MNVNDYVWVQLNEAGWAAFDEHFRLVGLDPEPYRRVHDQVPYQRFQMWELMSIFGPHIHMGMLGPLFERNELLTSEPVARPITV